MKTKPIILFIAPAHNEQQYQCALINSLLNQTEGNWKCIVYHNGPNQYMKNWVENIGDPRVVYMESLSDTGMWGCKNRQHAIDICDTDYVINTSVQDYYTPNTVQEISRALESGADIVHWQAINHLFRYSVLSGEIAFGHLDWGQWCIRTDIIKKVGVQKPSEFVADWHTVQAVLQSGLVHSVIKIDKILTVHN